ncbi:hypothetical protein EV361DRAFT_311599 [Lentinula raphanica]|nr:hypothetical protein EV361DRAFT_311599 [Lentinula raphanica]
MKLAWQTATTLLTLFVATVSAAPIARDFPATQPLPRNAVHIALDERTGDYVAFKRDWTYLGRYPAHIEGRNLERRGAPTCANLTVDEAKTLPGWSKIEDYADTNWGKGSRNIVTNPDDYPDSPALVCTSNTPVNVSFSGQPMCQTNNVTVTGNLEGTDGSVSVSVSQGFNASSSFTLQTTSSIGVSSTLGVSIGLPDVGSIGASVTMSTEVTNSQTKSFSASYNDMSTVKLNMKSPDGKDCNAITSVKSCTLQATGKIRYLAQGYIWFNYDSTTKGHYKWAAQIESILTDEDDRSSFANFAGSVDAATAASYKGTCK